MHRIVAALILIGLLSAIALGQQAAPQNKKDEAIDREIRRLNTDEHDAFMRNDVKALSDIWSNDFVVTNPFNQFVTKQQVLKLVENGTLAFKAYERTIEYIKSYGDTVIVAGSETCVWGGKIPMAGQTSHLRFTQVWRKQGAHWLEVARHANIIPPQQAKPAL